MWFSTIFMFQTLSRLPPDIPQYLGICLNRDISST
jgi:hypothetical protein